MMTKQNDTKMDSTQVLVNSGDAMREGLIEAIGYIVGCIGSSYCDSSLDDLEFVNTLEELAGVPLTTKQMFY